jgi:hypothetical protein
MVAPEPSRRSSGTSIIVTFPSRRVLSLVALATLACSGKIEDSADSSTLSGGAGGSSGSATGGSGATVGKGGGTGKGGGASGGSSGTTGDPIPGGVAEVTRVARLTHAQYQNTVNDLFGIDDDDSAAAFAPDALNGFTFDTSIDFRVDARLGPQYRAAAEALAARAVKDVAIYERIVPCDTTDAACPSDFIKGFGLRAFRHPLTASEQTRFLALFAQGPALVGSGDAFKDGVSLVVEAMLQSPQFLYRAELGTEPVADSQPLVRLDSFDVASRLSYFLWNTMPDDALLDGAANNALITEEQVASAATRLLASDRATGVAVSFHDQAWAFSRFSRIAPDAKTFPKAPSDIVPRVTDAAHAFVGDVVENDGGLRELLTANYAFADSALAPLYGKQVSGTGLQRIDFAADERQGILMQLGFLASNSYAIKTDPIHRGLFVLRNLLCVEIPDPPPGASQTPPPATNDPPKTTRGEVELLTGQTDCKGCHGAINPPGFAFEGFDAVGQIRGDENGEPLDTTGTLTTGGALDGFAFDTPFELVQQLANSPEAQACYASKWLEFAYGRKFSSLDAPAQAELGASPRSVHEVMAAITRTDSFRSRADNEVAP